MEQTDFMSVLRTFMARAHRTTTDLARLTGLSINTLKNWTGGVVRRPRIVSDVLMVARALGLDALDTTTLLTAAGHPPLKMLQDQAQQNDDTVLHMLLAPWPVASAPDPAPAAAPQVPLPRAARHQLRAPLADFVGRAREIDLLVTALRVALAQERGAIISGVQGMGGIGKTELAYVIAHQLRDAFPDAQIVLNLRGSSATPFTAEQTLQAVIHTLTPDAQLPDDLAVLEQHYRSLLHNARLLIIADDARDAMQVQALIPPAGSAVLITSRQRFTLPGMITVDLEQLGAGEAMTLLRHICPRLSRREAEALARGCGYLPLALRISSSLLRTNPALSVATYLERLGDERQRLDQLRDPEDRQLDVEASLALSYAQLEAATQQVFRQLGVFVADFATELAEAVVETPKGVKVEATLHRLLRHNLVLYDPARARWRLHDLVRDLARHYLDAAGETDATWWRYTWAAVRIAQAADADYLAGGDTVLAALERFDTERAHIDAGRRWAADHAGTEAGDRLLVADAEATDQLGRLRYDRLSERIPQLEGACAAAQRLADQRGEAIILNGLGVAYSDLGDPRQAIRYYEQVLALAQASHDRASESRALNNLGTAYGDLGDPRQAIRYYEQDLVLVRERGDRRGESISLYNIGICYFVLGDNKRTIPYYEQGLAIAREFGDRRIEGWTLTSLGRSHADLGDGERAIPYSEQGLAITRELGDRRSEAEALTDLGTVYTSLGDSGRAIPYYEQGLAITREVGDQYVEGDALCGLARALAMYRDFARVPALFSEALAIFETVGDRRGIALCCWYYGLFLAQLRERQRALPLLRAAIAYEQEIGHAKLAEHTALLAQMEAGEERERGS